MEWENLLSSKRRRLSQSTYPEADLRNDFQRDYDRLIFMSSFRRLQDKAQVFPLEANDFVRTRLTHSIEVSTIGRSLAIDVARRLADKVDKNQAEAIPVIVAASSLIHDLGNPPFGHFGETAIREWFKANSSCLDGISPEEQTDFTRFEGNAQALRIVTRLQMHGDEYGVNLTYGTLGSMIKYPWASADQLADDKEKFGYFRSEAKVFGEVVEHTGMHYRHPLVYLMEAADDIAYSAIDVEDAVKKGLLDIDRIIEVLEAVLENSQDRPLVDELKKGYANWRSKKGWPEPHITAIQHFRIHVHARMILACAETFIEHYSDIMSGDFRGSLVKRSNASGLAKALEKLARDHVYNAPEVLTLECVGNEVIHGLLDRFVGAVLSSKRQETKAIEGKLYKLISPTFRYLVENCPNETNSDEYRRVQLVTDFICGMTDGYALNFYQRIAGVRI